MIAVNTHAPAPSTAPLRQASRHNNNEALSNRDLDQSTNRDLSTPLSKQIAIALDASGKYPRKTQEQAANDIFRTYNLIRDNLIDDPSFKELVIKYADLFLRRPNLLDFSSGFGHVLHYYNYEATLKALTILITSHPEETLKNLVNQLKVVDNDLKLKKSFLGRIPLLGFLLYGNWSTLNKRSYNPDSKVVQASLNFIQNLITPILATNPLAREVEKLVKSINSFSSATNN